VSLSSPDSNHFPKHLRAENNIRCI